MYVCDILIDWGIDWSRAWVIKVIKGLSEWLNREWEWMKMSKPLFLKRTNERLFSYIFFLSKKPPEHGSSSTRWLDAKAKPLATSNK